MVQKVCNFLIKFRYFFQALICFGSKSSTVTFLTGRLLFRHSRQDIRMWMQTSDISMGIKKQLEAVILTDSGMETLNENGWTSLDDFPE
jgi:hypothetical protein